MTKILQTMFLLFLCTLLITFHAGAQSSKSKPDETYFKEKDSAKPAERYPSLKKVSMQYDKSYITLSLGAAFPHGDFSDYSLDNADNGFANLGIMYDMSFTYYLGVKFGLTALIRGQNNSIDLDDYLNEISGGGIDWSVNSDSWNINTFLFGIEIAFKNNEKGGTYSRLMCGVLNATYPEFKITLSNGYYSEYVKQASASGSGFAFLWSYGLRYHLSNKISMVGNIDLMGGFPEFKNVAVTSSITSAPLYDNIKTNIWTLNLSLGLGYTF